MTLDEIRKTVEAKMDQSIAAFKVNLTKVRTGRANPAFGREEQTGAVTPLDPLPHRFLGAIGHGGIDEADAKVDRPADDSGVGFHGFHRICHQWSPIGCLLREMPRHHQTGVAFGEPDRENRVVSLDGRIGPS